MSWRLVIITVVIFAGGLLLLRPGSSAPSSSAATAPSTSQDVDTGTVVTNGVDTKNTNTSEVAATTQEPIPLQPLNMKSPAQLTLGDVSHIAVRKGNEVIVFTDGSELTVTPYIRSQVSTGIQDRLGRSYGHE
jgi:hypothetical protein